MKFSELSNKDRYRIIRMGVQNGIHSVSDIEHIFDEGGHLYDGDDEKTQEINKAVPREILKEEEQYVKSHTKYNNFNDIEHTTRWAVINATNRAADFYNQDVKKRNNIYNNDYEKQALDDINYNMKNIKLATVPSNRSYYDPLTNEIILSKEGNSSYSPYMGAQSPFLKDIFIPYDYITPIIVHERTHEQQRKISPILTNLKLSPNISEHDRNILNEAYNTKPITELRNPFSSSKLHEKHSTNRESRYNLWNELSIQLGRNPSIKELNEYIKSMPFEELKKRLGGYKDDYDLLDEDAIKKALIEVAENKSNKNENINYT